MTKFHDLLRAGAEAHAGRPAILFEDETLSYADLLARSEGLAAGLRGHGVDADDSVALIMDNSLECVLAWLAASVMGCTDVPINPQYTGSLLLYLLQDSATSVVICDEAYAAHVLGLAAELPSLRLVVVNGGPPPARSDRAALATLDACRTDHAFFPQEGSAERIILYTSGTTGPSKGVVHSQASMLNLSRYNAEVMAYGADDRLLNFFPLYHQNARYTGVIPALSAGASIRLQRRLSTSTFWATCDADGITAFNYLGSVLRLILNVTPPERVKGTHSLRTAFGAGAPPAAWQDFEERLGIRLVETYGLSEAPMATLNTRDGSLKSPIGSAGRASELFEVAVMDEDDRFVAPGEIGEIVMRPKRPDALMIGYHEKDAATVRAYRNLWFHSGDRGRMSAEGELYFEDRQKDAIRRRGENISAWEVESVLEQHPAVAEVAVFGLPCDDGEEEVAAALVARDGEIDLADLVAFAAARLPAYAVPTLLRPMSDLPKTPTAKIQKAKLRAVPRSDYIAVRDL